MALIAAASARAASLTACKAPARPAALPATHRRRPLRCRAADKQGGEGGASGTAQQQAGQPAVPDAPPAPTGAAASEQSRLQQPAEASSSQAQTTMAVEEIQRRAALLRQQKAEEAAAGGRGGFVDGVLEEVRLIKWPAPASAAVNTALVIGIVAGTGVALLAINSLLAEFFELIY